MLTSLLGRFKTYLIIAGIMALIAGGFYVYFKWSQNEIAKLAANNARLEMAVQEQKKTIEEMVTFQRKQAKDLVDLQNDLNESRKYGNQLEEKLTKHDLEMLARKKPGLIEKRINDATKKVFEEIESNTGATR